MYRKSTLLGPGRDDDSQVWKRLVEASEGWPIFTEKSRIYLDISLYRGLIGLSGKACTAGHCKSTHVWANKKYK